MKMLTMNQATLLLLMVTFKTVAKPIDHVCHRPKSESPSCTVEFESEIFEERCYERSVWVETQTPESSDPEVAKASFNSMYISLRKYLKQVNENFRNPILVRRPCSHDQLKGTKVLAMFLSNSVFEGWEKPTEDLNAKVITLGRRCFFVYKKGGKINDQKNNLRTALGKAGKGKGFDSESFYTNIYGRKKNEVMFSKKETEKEKTEEEE